jgi:hypothetical protein
MLRPPASAAVSALLTVALCLQMPLARAGIVTSEQLTAQHRSDTDRAKILAFIERANVRDRIQAMGVDGLAARDRVAALDDEEAHAVAQRIDALPAGGNVGSFTDTQVIIVLLLIILVVVLVTA